MRVPHTVPTNTLQAYEPSPATLGLAGERGRRLHAELWSWDADAPPSLAHESLRTLVSEFDEHKRAVPLLEEDNVIHLLETLPTSLPLEVVVPLIPDGVYWRRRCQDSWATMNDVTRYADSWKRMFAERFVQDLLEAEEPGFTDWAEVGATLRLCAPYIRRLEVTQLRPPRVMTSLPVEPDPCNTQEFIPEHLDLSPVLCALPDLQDLSLQFGVKDIGMKFSFQCFRVHPRDVERLGQGLRHARSLRTLRIACSDIDDAKLTVILHGLEGCEGLEQLEVAHCRLADEGAKALGHFLAVRPSLRHLGLQNNQLGEAGAQALAYALTANGGHLQTLDLKFNLIGEEGGRSLATALARGSHPERLGLGGCGLGERAGMDLVHMLKVNRTLATLDLSNNRLGEEVGYMLAKALEHNHSLLKLDVRNCGFDEPCVDSLQRMTFRNREHVRRRLSAGGGEGLLAVPRAIRRGTSFVKAILVS